MQPGMQHRHRHHIKWAPAAVCSCMKSPVIHSRRAAAARRMGGCCRWCSVCMDRALWVLCAAGVDGTTLKEAKYINLSLHYLEQVIIALQERSMGLGRYSSKLCSLNNLTCLAGMRCAPISSSWPPSQKGAACTGAQFHQLVPHQLRCARCGFVLQGACTIPQQSDDTCAERQLGW